MRNEIHQNPVSDGVLCCPARWRGTVRFLGAFRQRTDGTLARGVAGQPSASRANRRRLCRRAKLRRMPSGRIPALAGLATRPGDAARHRPDRARRFPGCLVRLRRHHLHLLPARREIHGAHRRAGWIIAGLRDRLHLRRVSLAAVPDRLSRRPLSGAGPRLGQPAQGTGRTTLVPPLSRPEPHPSGPAALDRLAAELELHVRRVPFHESAQELRSPAQALQHHLVRNQRVLRSLPRSRRRSSRLGQQGRGLAKAGPHQGSGHRPRRTARPALSLARAGHERAESGGDRRRESPAQRAVDVQAGHGQRSAQHAAFFQPRTGAVRPLSFAARAILGGLRFSANRCWIPTGWRC